MYNLKTANYSLWRCTTTLDHRLTFLQRKMKIWLREISSLYREKVDLSKQGGLQLRQPIHIRRIKTKTRIQQRIEINQAIIAIIINSIIRPNSNQFKVQESIILKTLPWLGLMTCLIILIRVVNNNNIMVSNLDMLKTIIASNYLIKTNHLELAPKAKAIY